MSDNMLGLRVGNQGNLIIEFKKTDIDVGSNYEDKWCNIYFELAASNVNFKVGGEIITSLELNIVLKNAKMILDDKINETIKEVPIEQTIEFVFNKDNMRIIFYFFDSRDFYSLYLDKYNIKKLVEFLEKNL